MPQPKKSKSTALTKEHFDQALKDMVTTDRLDEKLKGLVTNETLDKKLKVVATKEDLKGLATKERLQAEADRIQNSIGELDKKMDDKFDAMLALLDVRDRVTKLEEQMRQVQKQNH